MSGEQHGCVDKGQQQDFHGSQSGAQGLGDARETARAVLFDDDANLVVRAGAAAPLRFDLFLQGFDGFRRAPERAAFSAGLQHPHLLRKIVLIGGKALGQRDELRTEHGGGEKRRHDEADDDEADAGGARHAQPRKPVDDRRQHEGEQGGERKRRQHLPAIDDGEDGDGVDDQGRGEALQSRRGSRG